MRPAQPTEKIVRRLDVIDQLAAHARLLEIASVPSREIRYAAARAVVKRYSAFAALRCSKHTAVRLMTKLAGLSQNSHLGFAPPRGSVVVASRGTGCLQVGQSSALMRLTTELLPLPNSDLLPQRCARLVDSMKASTQFRLPCDQRAPRRKPQTQLP